MGSRLKALCWFIEKRSPSDRERRSQFLWYVDANAAVPDDQARRSHSSDDAVSAVTVVAGGHAASAGVGELVDADQAHARESETVPAFRCSRRASRYSITSCA